MTTDDQDPHMPATTRRSLPIALLRAREAVMERFRPMLAVHGVTEQQWRVLRVVGEGGSMDAGVVAERACVLPPSLSRIIRTLEAVGLLRTSRDKNDGRRTLLTLTARGRSLLGTAAPESAAVHAAIEAAFGKDEVRRLLDQLERLQAALTQPSG